MLPFDYWCYNEIVKYSIATIVNRFVRRIKSTDLLRVANNKIVMTKLIYIKIK